MRSRKWKRGRKLPGRLAVVVKVNRKPINWLVYNYCNDAVIIYQPNFSLVIQNKKNLKRYIEILEKEWKLSIEEIRRFYAEDRLNPPDKKTLIQFEKEYIAKLQGKTVEELFNLEVQMQILNSFMEIKK